MNGSDTGAVRLPDGVGGSLGGKIRVAAPAGPGAAAPPLAALTHGAGGNLDTPGLAALAEDLARRGVTTLRFNLPAAEAGKRRPDRPAVAVRAVAAVAGWALERAAGARVWLGGRSFGGRMVSLFLAECGASASRFAGGLLLAYPLRPPGKPEVPAERVAHLPGIGTPLLFISGDRDPFAPPVLFEPVVRAAAGGEASLRWIRGADHGFRVAKAILRAEGRTAAGVREEIAAVSAAFILGKGSPGGRAPIPPPI